MWNCLWGHALKRSSGINRKSKVLYPCPRFLSSATWPLLLKKHNNGLIIISMFLKIDYLESNRVPIFDEGHCDGVCVFDDLAFDTGDLDLYDITFLVR